MESTKRRGSRDSLDSLLSHDSFQGEMDNFLQELRQNTKSAEPPRKKDIEEDNISEEKVKRELVENEKGDNNEKNLDVPQSPEQRADSPWSEASDTGVSSPEPDDRSPGRATASEEESGMDSDSERGSSRPSESYDEDDFEDYDITEDQQKAMLELQQLKLDLQDMGYEEDPPEYDVAERVRKLNEELANDPTPLEDDRARSIKFKDNLVDLVAPPPDYPSDEEDGGAGSGRAAAAKNGGAGNVTELNLNQMNLNGDSGQGAGGGDASGPPPRPASRAKGVSFGEERTVNRVEEVGGGGDDHRVSTTNGSTTNESTTGGKRAVVENGDNGADDEKILVQRGSTFELISASDLTAEEREIFLPPPDTDEDGQPGSRNSAEGRRSTSSASAPDSSFQPTPPREPRPATANGAHRRPVAPQPRRRAQSAAPARPIDRGGVHLNSSYKSPYAQPDELKKIGERQKREKVERERQQREIDRLEAAQREHQKEEHFLAWLQKKRSDGAWRKERPTEDEMPNAKKKEEKVHSEDGSTQDKEREAAFNEWLKTKKTQQKRERQVEEQRHQEEEQSWFDRPRQECDKAFRQYVFKEWLKKKKDDTKKAKKQEVARARINKLLVRRTRKAMQLARAIRSSQNYRYVDYYGYRS